MTSKIDDNIGKTEEFLKEETQNTESTTKEIETNETTEVPEWEDVLGSGGILKKLLRAGKPDTKPSRLDTCHIKMKLSLLDGTLVEEHDNLSIQLGDLDVVQGVDLAIGLMNEGEQCQLRIIPRLAYGTKGIEPVVPPDTTVQFDVELLAVEPEIAIEALSIGQRKHQGDNKRKRGNWWYSRGENNLAIHCYRRALDFLDEVEGGIKEPIPDDAEEETTDAALQELLEDRVSVHNNMAAAQIKQELYDAAQLSVEAVLRCQPNNVKALFRKATILKAKHDWNGALIILKKANTIAPDDADIQREMYKLNLILAKQKVTERELAKRMLNGSGKEEIDKNVKAGSSSNSKVWVISIAASIMMAMLSLAVYRNKYN